MKRIYRWLRKFEPPAAWKPVVIIVLGIFFGLLVYTAYISRAVSYLSDKPDTCVNCHIMAPQFATWFHSSHREIAHCNDCHVPHNNALNKYYYKAKDGLRHATIFTLRAEPQVIFIKEAGKEVVQQNCIRCHGELLHGAVQSYGLAEYDEHRNDRRCGECHRETPHGRVNSLSSTPNARVPVPGSPVPGWLKKYTEKK